MEYNKEVLTCEYSIISFFVRYHAYARGLEATKPKNNQHESFWAITHFSYFELAAIEWCKVFGSPKEALHWTKTPIGNTAEEARTDFRSRVLAETGFTQEKWKAYHKEMLVFRNKFLAHFDMGGVMESGIPPFEPTLQVAYAYEEWVEAIETALKERDSLRFRYKEWKAEASSVVSLYPHP
jgi:hypothetical protein